MKLKQTLIAVAIALTPMAAMAAGSLDVFYVNQNLETNGAPDDDGDGFGFRGQAALGQGVSLTALYQDADLDDANTSLRETRIGLSYDTKLQGINAGAGVETVNLDSNGLGISQRGYSVNAHASIRVIDNLSGYARVGYTDLNAIDGMEYEIGARLAINKQVGAFVEYRIADMDDNTGANTDPQLDTLRVGGSYNF